jgi:mono/diheme cytochrome c family protein
MRICALIVAVAVAIGCRARQHPSGFEASAVKELKELAVGGEDWTNPVPDTEQNVLEGREHFQHHCQICHGLDGQNTGVPFAAKTDPPISDLASPHVQSYKDGQLKWIIQNGMRFSGMPAWNGILSDEEMWKIVRFLRHLPAKGSLGAPKVYSEASSAHEHTPGHEHAPQHKH